MTRLIDADALPVYRVKILHAFGIIEGNVIFHDDVKNAPTIDAAPVVRCKDCVYYIKNPYYDSEGGRAGYCEKIEYIMDGYYRGAEDRQPDDYCSQGEPNKICPINGTPCNETAEKEPINETLG